MIMLSRTLKKLIMYYIRIPRGTPFAPFLDRRKNGSPNDAEVSKMSTCHTETLAHPRTWFLLWSRWRSWVRGFSRYNSFPDVRSLLQWSTGFRQQRVLEPVEVHDLYLFQGLGCLNYSIYHIHSSIRNNHARYIPSGTFCMYASLVVTRWVVLPSTSLVYSPPFALTHPGILSASFSLPTVQSLTLSNDLPMLILFSEIW